MICLYWCQNGCQWLHTFRRYVRWRFNWTQSFDFIRKTRLGITVNVLIFSVVICKKNNRSRFLNPTILFDSLTYTYSGIYRWNICYWLNRLLVDIVKYSCLPMQTQNFGPSDRREENGTDCRWPLPVIKADRTKLYTSMFINSEIPLGIASKVQMSWRKIMGGKWQ